MPATRSPGKRRKRTPVSMEIEHPRKKLEASLEVQAPDFNREPHGNAVAYIDGKRFYRSICIDGEIFTVGDSVDVLRSCRTSAVRLTNLARIAALFQGTDGVLRAEVAFYFDCHDKVPWANVQKRKSGGWTGFSHENEVVGFNKFEIIDIEAFDEKVTVHGTFEDYQRAIDDGGDEEINAFCRFVCFSEGLTILPIQNQQEWTKIMCDGSKYHSLYHATTTTTTREPEAAPRPSAAESESEDDLYNSSATTTAHSHGVIIGREVEAEKIKTFLETGIKQGGTGQTLYISGVPGSGKTATVGMVVAELSAKKLRGTLPWFNLVEINAVHLSTPNELYRVLYTRLFGKPAPSALASYKILDKYFSSKSISKAPSVVILDEADYIVTRTQKVLFTLFDWPSKPASKLILAIISNTMDLATRMKPSCASRLAFGSLVFHPYNYQQILKVVRARLGPCANVDPVALQLCARRVTNYSGDMRKALQICKVAIKEANGAPVTTAEMNRITNMILNSAIVDSLAYISTGMKCLLVALVLELRDTRLNVACALDIFKSFKAMFTSLNPQVGQALTRDSFKHLLLTAANVGLVSLEPAVFASKMARSETNHSVVKRIYRDINEDLGDTGIVPQVDVGQVVTALSRDTIWEPKLRNF